MFSNTLNLLILHFLVPFYFFLKYFQIIPYNLFFLGKFLCKLPFF